MYIFTKIERCTIKLFLFNSIWHNVYMCQSAWVATNHRGDTWEGTLLGRECVMLLVTKAKLDAGTLDPLETLNYIYKKYT